jgi:hypothetical protein
MLSTVVPLGNGSSQVSVNADVELAGKIVQFGRGMVEEVSRQMFRQFSTCVKQHLETAEDPQPTANPAPEVQSETKAVAAAPLAFRAIWAIFARFFKGLFGKAENK